MKEGRKVKIGKAEVCESPVRATPRPLVTVRHLRANLKKVLSEGEVRVIGDRLRCKCIIIPVPPFEWRRKDGLDKRMSETRKKFEGLMAILER
jgi:hypothetical protein